MLSEHEVDEKIREQIALEKTINETDWSTKSELDESFARESVAASRRLLSEIIESNEALKKYQD